MPSSMNIEERSLEDLVQRGTVKDIIRKLETTPVLLDDESYHDYYLVITALSERNIRVADLLISNGFRVYKNVKTHPEKTPLHYAIEIANFKLIETLLLHGASLDIATVDDNDVTPLHMAINQNNTRLMSLLISNTSEAVLDDMYLYHYAVETHHINLIKLLLRKELLPTKKNQNNETAFCLAVKEDHPDILCLLWELLEKIMNSNPDQVTLIGLMFVAVIIDDKDSILELLDTGCDFTVSTSISPCEDGWALFEYFNGFSLLHCAVKYGQVGIVDLFLENFTSVDIEQETYWKVSPLHIAARETSLQLVKLLIRYSADITKQDYDGNTPVHYAFAAKNYEILDFLLTVHAIINANPVNSAGISHFHIACTRDDLSIVTGFLRNGAIVNDCVPIDPNIQYVKHNDDIDWRGCSPLHFAAAFNRREIVQFLLEQDADVTITDARGFTPLHVACQNTYEKFGTLIEDYLKGMLIFEEMDRDYRHYDDSFIDDAETENEFIQYHRYDFFDLCNADNESTMVEWSPNRKDHVIIIKQLIRYKSDVNKLDIFGNGPLFYICYFNLKKILATMNHAVHCKKVIRMLLLKSLMKEMCLRRKLFLNYFLEREVNMEQCYKNGSILHYISMDRQFPDIERLEIMKIFLHLGANINATNEKMQTPLHLATRKKDIKSVELLLDYNANVNCTEAQNLTTPLHIATSLSCVEIIDLLLAKGADVHMKQLNGKTPLHILLSKRYYICSKYKPIFQSFLSIGADVNVPDSQGKTPLLVACETIIPSVIEDLLNHGADMTVADCSGETIYQCVYRQIKHVINAYGRLQQDLFDIFWTLLNHAVKLNTIELISVEAYKEISQNFFQLKELLKSLLLDYENQDLNNLVSKCFQEIEIFRNTEIHTNVSIYDLLFEEDCEMIKYINNSRLKAVIESDSFDDTYSCYGYLLKLKFYRGVERSKLLPTAKQCLIYLTNSRLSDCFHNILIHLNNSEMRDFIRIVSLIKCDKQSSTKPICL